MADPVWGLLPKAQDNPQTIDEAISAAIAAHEADPEAHLGDGESLEAHRSNFVIDHPANSVVGDKFGTGSLTNNFYQTDFTTIDDWGKYGLGGDYGSFYGRRFVASGLANNYIVAYLEDILGDWLNSELYDFRFDAILSANFSTSHEGWLGFDVDHNGFVNPGDPSWGLAFKFLSGKIYAAWTDDEGSVSLEEISATIPTGFHKYSLSFSAGHYIRWYFDDALVFEKTDDVFNRYVYYLFGISVDKHTGSGLSEFLFRSLVIERVPIS